MTVNSATPAGRLSQPLPLRRRDPGACKAGFRPEARRTSGSAGFRRGPAAATAATTTVAGILRFVFPIALALALSGPAPAKSDDFLGKLYKGIKRSVDRGHRSNDRYILHAVRRIVTFGKPGDRTRWKNSRTGIRGMVTLLSRVPRRFGQDLLGLFAYGGRRGDGEEVHRQGLPQFRLSKQPGRRFMENCRRAGSRQGRRQQACPGQRGERCPAGAIHAQRARL